MSRGNLGDLIYRDEFDREAFLKCLGQASEKTRWMIHAYVPMRNNCHLLLGLRAVARPHRPAC
jgi:hypothetical protein